MTDYTPEAKLTMAVEAALGEDVSPDDVREIVEAVIEDWES